VRKMETSLRYATNSRSLKIHAKEKFPVNSKTRLQVNFFKLLAVMVDFSTILQFDCDIFF